MGSLKRLTIKWYAVIVDVRFGPVQETSNA
jgi:hypothetical protein